MSYDLYFYKKQSNITIERDFINKFKEMIPINKSEVGNQIDYENKRTGVYFMIDFNEPLSEIDDIKIFDSFNNFEYLNISTSINFLRPDYFGKEIFPIIVNLCDELDLYILNLQEEDSSKHIPLKWNKQDLIEHWTNQNSKISKQQYSKLNLNYLDKKKSDSLWNYTSMINYYDNNINEDVFVPNAYLIKDKDTNELSTFVIWGDSIPILLPEVDYIVMIKKYKKFFKEVEEIGVVKYKDIIDNFYTFFDIYDHEKNLLILRQENANLMKNKFNKLEFWKEHKEIGPQVSLDGFVNNK